MASNQEDHPAVRRPPYTPLDTSNQSVRLLRLSPSALTSSPLRCELIHASLETSPPPKYEALSYVWGPPEFTEIIAVDGHDCGITKSLDAALRRLRRKLHSRVIWVDQICINQDDLAERSSQVLLMGKLYASAERVVAWLGKPPAHGFEQGMDWLRHYLVGLNRSVPFAELYLSSPAWSPGAIRRKATYAVGRAVPWDKLRLHMTAKELHILERVQKYIAAFDEIPYWSRMWILQEFILAKDTPVLLLGEELVLDNDFLQAALWARTEGGVMRQIADTNERAYGKEGLARYDAWSAVEAQEVVEDLAELRPPVFGFAKHLTARAQLKDDGWLLSAFLRDTYELQSGDPRDKVYALYSMVPRHYDLPVPDYTLPVDTVLRDVMACVIAVEGTTKVYDWLGPSPPDSPWPSWTPDFAAPENSTKHGKYNLMRLVSFVPQGAKASGTELHGTPSVDDSHMFLTVHGWTIDEISLVLKLPGETHGMAQVIDAAWKLARHVEEVLGRDKPENMLQTGTSQLMDFLDSLKHITTELDFGGDDPVLNNTPENGDGSKSLMARMGACTLSRDVDEGFKRKISSLQFRAMDLEDSTLFCTARGYVGFVYEKHRIQPGDVAVVLTGCDFPYILRRKRDGWVMIGSAFVSGIMNGELIDRMREEGSLGQVDTFTVV
jgi:hypothetical protein